ncbi:MAG: tetratricopeptide repeat protein [Treponema sp.]|nr:tetratricopeptide repeat protein [Treponema sp.]
MNRFNRLHITFFTAVTAVMFLLMTASCSTSPKNSGDVTDIRILTEKELASANREAGRGNLEIAFGLLTGCKTRAIMVDDTSLMIRSGLSLGNTLFSLGRNEEAFAEIEKAVAMAQNHGDSELLSISRIFLARGRLITGGASAQSVLDEVNRYAGNIRKDRLYIAFSWQVRGLALRELGSFAEAENSVRRSLDIHVKDKYLENAAYDWYMIASIRSLAGNASGAVQALESSLDLDRRVENTWGLAANWRAMGDVHRRAGKSKEAAEAWQRSRAIFAAMGNDYEVAEIDKRLTGN